MKDEQTTEELIEHGLAALEVAEFDEAIELFGQAAIEDSSNARAWFYLGLCYFETRQPDLAREALNRAVGAAPDYADAHYLLGTVAGATGELDLAAESYRRALAIDPHHHKAEEFLIRTEALLASREHYRSAVRLIHAEKRERDWLNRAARELLQSVAIFKDSPAQNEFARLAREVIASGNRVMIPDARASEGPFWSNAVERAEAAFARKNWPEAASNYKDALDLSSGHAFIHHALGLIYFELGDAESGVSAWQRAVDLDPDYDLSAIGQLGK
ncbi:MAG TPA: tetratricopeptide repeat protein [Blastocatellia bacterium]|nr:tetratricopeptide repeat protein [Blastocatellia bacterium]